MIEVQIDTSGLTAALERLAAAGTNPEPAWQEAGEYLVVSTKRRFADKQAPDGSMWPGNSPGTQAAKGNDDPLIGESKRLGREIHYRAKRGTLEWGSPMEYAATQHYGAEKGAFGQTEGGLPLPWGDIPARPFLGLSDDDRREVTEILEEFVQEQWG